MPHNVLQLDPRDNVLIALTDLKAGESVEFGGQTYILLKNVPAKHKFSTQELAAGARRYDGATINYPAVVGFGESLNLLTAAGLQAYQVLDYPGEGLFPTSTWSSGMWLVDRYELKRPKPDSGPYTVTLTLFTSDADNPLVAQGPSGRLPADTIVLSGIQVPRETRMSDYPLPLSGEALSNVR